jgi:hypothetical protein
MLCFVQSTPHETVTLLSLFDHFYNPELYEIITKCTYNLRAFASARRFQRSQHSSIWCRLSSVSCYWSSSNETALELTGFQCLTDGFAV